MASTMTSQSRWRVDGVSDRVRFVKQVPPMKTRIFCLAAPLALAAAANAGLAFSFSDPVPGRQLTNVQGNQYGAGTGQIGRAHV